MPILPHAKKKLRVDVRRTAVNRKVRTLTKKAIKDMRAKPTSENLVKAYSALDRAAKRNIIHIGKADRLKSRLSKLVVAKKKTVKSVKAKPKKTK